MKKLFFAAMMLMLASTAMAQIPSVKVEDGKGRAVDTATLVDGQTPMIISFWAVTCKPCIRELDAINEVLPDWLDVADFRVVAVSTDDARFSSQARSLAEGHGWSDYTLLYDKNGDFKRAMNVQMTPQVYVVDKDGNIVYAHTGYTAGGEYELFEVIQGLQ